MEVTRTNGNTDTNKIDLTNLREVHVYNEDGSIKETFWFPISPPPPIVIEDSSDTESEKEEEEQQLEKKDEEKEKEDEKAEAEEEREEEAEAEKEEEADDKEAEKEEEEPKETNKRRRDFMVNEPTPQRALRSNNIQSICEALQPAPTLTPEPTPSDLFPPLQLPAINSKLQMEIEMADALVKTSPMLAPVPTPLSPPTSPLPDLDLTMDIDDFDKKI